MIDNINPAHYRQQPVECIEFTQWLNFCLGNAFKYIWRYAHKGGIEDLHKAEWYLQRQISESPIYCELDADMWDYGAGLLRGCTFTPLQHKALSCIWSAAWCDSGGDLPAALASVHRIIAVSEIMANSTPA